MQQQPESPDTSLQSHGEHPVSPETSIVFVLGSTRSGTSAVRNAVAATRYRGPGEGHVMGLVPKLHDAVSAYYRSHAAALEQGTLLAKIPESDWHQGINALVRRLVEQASPGQFVLDKTPTIEPLHALPYIEAAWPEAKFIFCRRRGIDNIMSKQRKWPDSPFENLCREWAAVNDAWDEKKKGLRSGWIEVEFYDLVNDVQDVSRRVGILLALTEEETGLVAKRLGSARPQTTSDVTSHATLSGSGWSDRQVELFRKICGSTMERCGYGYSDYWQTPRAQ